MVFAEHRQSGSPINKYFPLRDSTQVYLPKEIKEKKAVINVKMKYCFKTMLSKQVTGPNPQWLIEQYYVLEDKYDFHS